MLTERDLKTEPREHDNLRDDGQNVANGDIRDRFDQRHQPGLGHASNPKRLRALLIATEI
jgi:hypothetical protein